MTDSPPNTDLDEIRWLIASADAELAPPLPSDPLKLASHFRKRHSASRSRLLSELHELRQRGSAKFSDASSMFFSRVGYEQSTSEIVANYKATRFPENQPIVDLCCGIGGDAIALGRRASQLTIVDRSETVLELTKANLRVHGIDHPETRIADVRDVPFSNYSTWHIDPDRRADGQRRSHAESCDPPLDEFLRHVRDSGGKLNGAVKLSPAADVSELLEQDVELEWIGSYRECQQLVAWFGSLAESPGRRTATWLTGDAHNPVAAKLAEGESRAAQICDPYENLPTFVYEPRPSVRAAQLESSLAHRFSLMQLAPGVSLFASTQEQSSPLFNRFKAIDVRPFRRKQLKKWLKSLNVQVTEVKKRDVDLAPDALLREISSASTGEPAVLLLFPIGKSTHAMVASRSDS